MPSQTPADSPVRSRRDPRRRPRPRPAARPGAARGAEDEQPRPRALGLLRADRRRASELTIQSTGIGGPSAALVLADLAELGVRRAVRVGTCPAAGGEARLGELVLVERALAGGGSAASFGLAAGEAVAAGPGAHRGRCATALGDGAGRGAVASFDSPPRPADPLGAGDRRRRHADGRDPRPRRRARNRRGGGPDRRRGERSAGARRRRTARASGETRRTRPPRRVLSTLKSRVRLWPSRASRRPSAASARGGPD